MVKYDLGVIENFRNTKHDFTKSFIAPADDNKGENPDLDLGKIKTISAAEAAEELE